MVLLAWGLAALLSSVPMKESAPIPDAARGSALYPPCKSSLVASCRIVAPGQLRLRGGVSAVCDDGVGLERSPAQRAGDDVSSRHCGARSDGTGKALEVWQDWAKYLSRRRGTCYWFNRLTKKTQWRDPRGVGGGQRAPASSDDNAAGRAPARAKTGAGASGEAWSLPHQPGAGDARGAGPADERARTGSGSTGGWTMHISQRNGQPYWFHGQTGKSRWTDPGLESEVAPENGADAAGLCHDGHDGHDGDTERDGRRAEGSPVTEDTTGGGDRRDPALESAGCGGAAGLHAREAGGGDGAVGAGGLLLDRAGGESDDDDPPVAKKRKSVFGGGLKGSLAARVEQLEVRDQGDDSLARCHSLCVCVCVCVCVSICT